MRFLKHFNSIIKLLLLLGGLGKSCYSKRLGDEEHHHRRLSDPGYCGEHYDVIIVGAGMAGLTAAKTLKDANKNFTVLEIRHEVGGRMRTTNITEEAGFVIKGEGFEGVLDEGARYAQENVISL